ncbi:MAG TPA: alpha/beta fold hydrolase [Solirubrobacterales bacterium]|nr:alpha/beta fold hydrolase [Solirubrobacterales bacterium]
MTGVSAEPFSLDPRIVAGNDYGNPEPRWREIDWRAHLRRVELPGADVNYVEIGEGPPIVFVHGISGCWQNWLENLPVFGAGRRAIALDLPGFGASPMPSWEIDMAAYARLLNDFCEKLGLEGATLVGNSMGGLIVVEAATAVPTRFERLVLVSAAGIINTWQPQARATATAWAWKEFGPHFASRSREIVSRPRLRELVFRPFLRYPNRLREDLLWEQIANGLKRADGFGDALQALIVHDSREKLPAIEIPTLIVWGLSDRVVPVAAAASFHRRIPRSRLEVFERTGHVPQLERPLRFNAVLEDFLANS